MPQYAIGISPDEASEEYNVVLHGPGIGAEGRRYVFASTYRCAAFEEAVNFAYRQGLADGKRQEEKRQEQQFDDRLLMVTGTTPDTLSIRPEDWWSRLKRRVLTQI